MITTNAIHGNNNLPSTLPVDLNSCPANDHTPSILDHALALAAAGFRVFPLVEDGKEPAIESWQKKATTDPARIQRWFACPFPGVSNSRNVGIATGGGLAVVDLDVKNGKAGLASLDKLQAEHGILPETLVSITPSGGRHLLFTVPSDVPNSAGTKLGSGLDIRGAGGFIVAPGSTTELGEYRWFADRGPGATPMAPMPEWLRLKCGTPRVKATAPVAVELDTEASLAKATAYLDLALPAVEGAGGDATAFQVAAFLRDFGVSEQAALELMLDRWNERCSPPWMPEDLERKVANAYAYGQNAPGAKSPTADFGAVAPSEVGTADGSDAARRAGRLPLLFFRDMKLRGERPSLIAGLLDHGALSLVYGQSNVGKSFLLLDMALCIARGIPWQGLATERRGVVYLAAEGGASIEARIAAYKKHHALGSENIPFAVIPAPADLHSSPTDAGQIVMRIREAEAEFGIAVGLAIIDTLARVMSDGDENTAKDMGKLVTNLAHIGSKTGAHVMVVHHPGKDESKGARGNSSLKAAVDTELEVKSVGGKRTAKVEKQRDYETNRTFEFTLTKVEIGHRPDGTPITSCVVTPVNVAAAREFAQPKLKGHALTAYEALQTLSGQSSKGIGDPFAEDGHPWVAQSEWRLEFDKRQTKALKSDTHRTNFERAEKALLQQHRIEQDGKEQDGKNVRLAGHPDTYRNNFGHASLGLSAGHC